MHKAFAVFKGVCGDSQVSVVVCLFLFRWALICRWVIGLAELVGVGGGGDTVVISADGNQANFEAFVFVSKRNYARLTAWLYNTYLKPPSMYIVCLVCCHVYVK